MKKFASIMLAAAMILSLTACGEKEKDNAESTELSAEAGTAEQHERYDTTEPEAAVSTSPTTASAATTAATTITTEAATTTAPPVEEEPVQADPTVMTGDVTLGAALPYSRDVLYGAYGDVAFIGEMNENGYFTHYYLVDINGIKITDTEYYRIGRGFDETETAVAYSDWQTSFIIDKQGNVIYENAASLSDGVLITKEVTGESESYGEIINNYKYIYTDIETGTELFSIDEMADAMSPKNYNVNPMLNGYSVITQSRQSAASLWGVYIVDRQGNKTEVYDNESGNKPEIFGDGANIAAYDENGYLYLRLLADGIQYMIYDMHDDTYTILPFEGNNWSFTYSNRDKGIFAINDGTSAQLFDKDFNVLLDGLTKAVASGCDKYILISDSDKWGYYVIENGETVWFDDATNFHKGYAFVIEDGKGRFINEAFEAVTDDIAAIGATHYDGLLYLSDTEQFYPVNYPVAE